MNHVLLATAAFLLGCLVGVLLLSPLVTTPDPDAADDLLAQEPEQSIGQDKPTESTPQPPLPGREAVLQEKINGSPVSLWLDIIERGSMDQRYPAFSALRTLGCRGLVVVDRILPLLGEESNGPYLAAVLAEMGELVVPHLATELRTTDSARVRKSLLHALSILGPKAVSAVGDITAVRTDESYEVRFYVMIALDRIGARVEGLESWVLAQIREETYPSLPHQAAQLVGRICNCSPELTDALVRLLDQDGKYSKLEAMDALVRCEVSTDAAIAAVRRATQVPYVAKEARAALSQLTAKDR